MACTSESSADHCAPQAAGLLKLQKESADAYRRRQAELAAEHERNEERLRLQALAGDPAELIAERRRRRLAREAREAAEREEAARRQ